MSGNLELDTRGDRLVVGNAPAPHSPEWWSGDIHDVSVFPRALARNGIAALASR